MYLQSLNVKVGDPLPEFTLTAQLPDGRRESVYSADLRGRPLVLFFYPQADTPG
jgi:peroxiredoxin Q/BCP